MTDLYAPEGEAEERNQARSTQRYEVFNPDHSVGVACDLTGAIVGLHLGDEIRDNSESWLSAEIVRVARLAYLKSLAGRRTEMARNGVLPHVLDALDMPTQAQYLAMENAEFGDQF
ncbi:hypothetical protein [Nocardia vaccinii]|uniref:hypothetical protein n=1 Tax=Nocardia vaccinii TaxID=1822 RepID=UPI00082E8AA9|nr:hypothetical protein [Nocardia vaccinii]